MLRMVLVGRTQTRGQVQSYEREGGGISYARAGVEVHGRLYIGSAGVAYAMALGTDAQQQEVNLIDGLDFGDVYHFNASAIQLGGNDDPLLQDFGRLRAGLLVRFELEEIRQISKTTGYMVDRRNVVALQVLDGGELSPVAASSRRGRS